MTSTVRLTGRGQSLLQILGADPFSSSLGTLVWGHLDWEQVHPTVNSHDQPIKHLGQGLAMELVLGMATSGRPAVRLEVE